MLILKSIQEIKNIKDLKSIYYEAFPENERVPLFYLKYKAKKSVADFFVVYDDTSCIGMVYTVYYNDIIFILYLAVKQNQRGNGYGSKILNLLKSRFPNKRIILNIEEVIPNCENYSQRLKRQDFYSKNGFKLYDLNTQEGDINYQMMYYNKSVSYEEYSQLIQNFMGKFLFKMYYKRR